MNSSSIMLDLFNFDNLEKKSIAKPLIYQFAINNYGASRGSAYMQCGIAAFLYAIAGKLFFLRYNKRQNYKYVTKEQQKLFVERIDAIGNQLFNWCSDDIVKQMKKLNTNITIFDKASLTEWSSIATIIDMEDDKVYAQLESNMWNLYKLLHNCLAGCSLIGELSFVGFVEIETQIAINEFVNGIIRKILNKK